MSKRLWLRAALVGAVVFLRDELLSVAFWKFWGLPIVGAAVYFVASILSGPFGPLVVLGTMASFALGCVSSAALQHRAYLRIAIGRMQSGKSVPDLKLPSVKLLRPGGEAPDIEVTRFPGNEAILMIVNKGGDAFLSGEGQLVGISPGSFRHHAPYRVCWRETTGQQQEVTTDRVLVKSGDRIKLVLASCSLGQWGSSLRIHGDAWVVDSFSLEKHNGESPAVTIDVTLFAEPPLKTPYKARHTVICPPKRYSVDFLS